MSTGESCPLCGRTKGMNRNNLLYGCNVCKKCRNGFANRLFTGQPVERKGEFAPVAAPLAPVRETGNPYQPPRQ